MTNETGSIPQSPDPRNEKPEWAMNQREIENARRRRAGEKPLPRRWPWVLLGLAVLGGGGYWYYRTQILPTLPTAEIVSAEPEPVISQMQVNPYEYATVTPVTLQRLVRVTGTLKPSRQSQISSQTTGRVDEVTVRPGDRVGQGELLVQVDLRQLQITLDLQRATAEATRAQLKLAEAQLERVKALSGRGVSSSSDLDSAQTSVDGLRAQLSALVDQVASAELSLQQATVVAPFAGIIAERSVEPGQIVTQGTALMTLVDLHQMEFQAFAPLAAGPSLKAGQKVSVTVDGIRDLVFTGTVTRINPIATEGARTLPVYITLDNEDGLLRGGMYSVGQIVVEELPEALAVPAEALREDRTGAYVLKVTEGKVERQSVTTGKTWAGNMVEISEGLTPGEVVITAALPELDPGDAVVLVE